MLIPAVISWLVSTIFLNLGLALGGQFLVSENINYAKAGLVLGVSEYQAVGKVMVEQGNNFNDAMTEVINGAKSLPIPP